MKNSTDAAEHGRGHSPASRRAGRSGAPPPRGRWLGQAACLLLAVTFPGAVRAAPLLNLLNGHSYEAVSRPNGLTWAQANAAANARLSNGVRGHLATITSPAESDFIVQHFPEAIDGGYWLGGFQLHGLRDPAAGWVWVTGEPFSFTNWNNINGGEPNDYEGPGTSDQDENRLHFWFQAEGRWNDLRPTDAGALGFMVEYEPDPPSAAPAITGYTAATSAGTPITSAAPGTPILIAGSNLGTGGTVVFDGIPLPAAAATWSPTQILVWVPTAPTYPFHAPVTVTVDGQPARGDALMITAPLPGQDNLLANASFEYPDSGASPAGSTYGQPLHAMATFSGYTIPGWRIPFGTIDVLGEATWAPAPGQGHQSIDLVGTPGAGIIAQSFFTTVGQDYLFAGWAAHNPGINEARADVYLNDEFFVQLRHKGFTTAGDLQWAPFLFRFRATADQTTLAIQDVSGKNEFQGLTLDGLSVRLAP